MSIGTMIKKLRRERDMTQEQLAEYLNITSQAISQWECDKSAPDISQLPILANIFEVSSDVLLGIDVDRKQKQIEKIHCKAKEYSEKGYHNDAVEILRNGLREYPDSYKLMGLLASELCIFYHNEQETSAEKDRRLHETAKLCDKIIAECTDNALRNEIISISCHLFPEINRYNDALKLAESMPSYTNGELLSRIYTGTKRFEQNRDNIMGMFSRSIGDTCSLAISKNDDGSPVYSEDEILEIHKKTIAMFKLFFEDGDYMYHSQYLKVAHMAIVKIYAKQLDVENTLTNLEHCAKYTIMFDTYDYNASHTSLLARGSVAGGIWKNDTTNDSYDLLSDMSGKQFNFVRSNPRFSNIESELKKYAIK